MDMSGTQRIEASREVVYAALNDVEVLRQCIPGCETVEKTGENELAAKVTLKIGPVKASFTGKVTNGALGALCFAPSNFIVGSQRGVRVDTQELVETQRRVFVASLRTGMTQLTTNLGSGVGKLVYAA